MGGKHLCEADAALAELVQLEKRLPQGCRVCVISACECVCHMCVREFVCRVGVWVGAGTRSCGLWVTGDDGALLLQDVPC
jgi:hypothetical protein